MNKENYFTEKRAEYKKMLDKVNTHSERFGGFGDLETRSMYLIGMQPLFFNPSEFKEGFYDAVREACN